MLFNYYQDLMQRIYHKPYKLRYSQNFLQRAAASRLVAKMQLDPNLPVIEIGPGTGTLTRELMLRNFGVWGIELDANLAGKLSHSELVKQGLTIINADFLNWTLPSTPCQLVGNIPFGLSAEILRKILSNPCVRVAYLIVPKHVAEKYSGSPVETLQSLLAKLNWEIELISKLKRADFIPYPRVDSVLLEIRHQETTLLPKQRQLDFEQFIRAIFTVEAKNAFLALVKVVGYPKAKMLCRQLGVDLKTPRGNVQWEIWIQLFLSQESR